MRHSSFLQGVNGSAILDDSTSSSSSNSGSGSLGGGGHFHPYPPAPTATTSPPPSTDSMSQPDINTAAGGAGGGEEAIPFTLKDHIFSQATQRHYSTTDFFTGTEISYSGPSSPSLLIQWHSTPQKVFLLSKEDPDLLPVVLEALQYLIDIKQLEVVVEEKLLKHLIHYDGFIQWLVNSRKKSAQTNTPPGLRIRREEEGSGPGGSGGSGGGEVDYRSDEEVLQEVGELNIAGNHLVYNSAADVVIDRESVAKVNQMLVNHLTNHSRHGSVQQKQLIEDHKEEDEVKKEESKLDVDLQGKEGYSDSAYDNLFGTGSTDQREAFYASLDIDNDGMQREDNSDLLGSLESDEEPPLISIKDIHPRISVFTEEMGGLDLILTFGGDGLLLYVNTLFQTRAIPPVMCFDFGSLGFLSPFQYANFQQEVDEVLNGTALLTLRMRLQCTIYRFDQPRGVYHVLNEAVIDRGPSPYLSVLDLSCDSQYLTTLQGDGVIFSTPTGSTAYSLAAGGSIIYPAVPAILLTPICAHSLSFRPMLLPDSAVMMCEIPRECRTSGWVSFDGKYRQELHRGNRLEVRLSPFPMPTINK